MEVVFLLLYTKEKRTTLVSGYRYVNWKQEIINYTEKLLQSCCQMILNSRCVATKSVQGFLICMQQSTFMCLRQDNFEWVHLAKIDLLLGFFFSNVYCTVT